MDERFLELFRFPKNLYADGSPVLLEAGVLLKDSKTQRILAQMKWQNVHEKAIKGVRLIMNLKGIDGSVIYPSFEYSYLDLDVKTGGEFGSRVPVFMPDDQVREMNLLGVTVFFSDGSSYTTDRAEWSALPEQEKIENRLQFAERIRQWYIQVGPNSGFVPVYTRGLYRCTCGASNPGSARQCVFCQRPYEMLREYLDEAKLDNLVQERLRRQEEARLAEEARKREEEEQRRKALEEQERQKRLAAKKRRRTTLIVLAVFALLIGAAVAFFTLLLPKLKYNKAMSYIAAGDYESGYAILEEIGDYQAIKENKYDRVKKLIEAENYDEAYKILAEFKDFDAIADNKIDRAIEFINREKLEDGYQLLLEVLTVSGFSEEIYEKAQKALDSLGEKKIERASILFDNKKYTEGYNLLQEVLATDRISTGVYERAQEVLLEIPASAYYLFNVGDIVTYGTYEQDNKTSNGKEAIEWIILEKREDKMLVISRYALDCQPYDSNWPAWQDENSWDDETNPVYSVTWENCSLRKWLNDTFMTQAFDTEEQKKILVTTLFPNEDSSYYVGAKGGQTKDKVFLLSSTEYENFESYLDYKNKGTEYCYAQGAYKSKGGTCRWWLRTPLWFAYEGDSDDSNLNVSDDQLAVRPAMWISIDP